MAGLRRLIVRHRALAAALVVVLAAAIGVGAWLGVRAAQDDVMPLEKVFKQYQEYLLNLPGVVSVGIGERYGKRFIQVYVRVLTPKVAAGIPTTLGGWKVRTLEIPASDPEPQSPIASPNPTAARDPDTLIVDVRGTITAVTRMANPQGNLLGWIIVDGVADPDTTCSEASVAITSGTVFYVVNGSDLQPVDAAFSERELRGEMVEVEFSGQMSSCDPPQATAAVVVFVAAGD
jgi:hypothetical protein